MAFSAFLFFFVPMPFIALLAFIIAAIKSYQEEGGEDVIKNVYVYLVLFVTLMMIIGGSVSAFMSMVDIIAPSPYYQSFDDYRRWQKEIPNKVDGDEEQKVLTDAEIRENYNEMVIAYKETQIERSKNALIKSTGWIIIPLPIFFFFQRLIPRKKAQ